MSRGRVVVERSLHFLDQRRLVRKDQGGQHLGFAKHVACRILDRWHSNYTPQETTL